MGCFVRLYFAIYIFKNCKNGRYCIFPISIQYRKASNQERIELECWSQIDSLPRVTHRLLRWKNKKETYENMNDCPQLRLSPLLVRRLFIIGARMLLWHDKLLYKRVNVNIVTVIKIKNINWQPWIPIINQLKILFTCWTINRKNQYICSSQIFYKHLGPQTFTNVTDKSVYITWIEDIYVLHSFMNRRRVWPSIR